MKLNFKEELGMLKALEKVMGLTGENEDLILKKKHDLVLQLLKNTLPYYKDKDVVEFEHTLIPDEKLQVMWENIHVYSYDTDKFFLDEGVLHLTLNNKVMYKICFTVNKGQNIAIIMTAGETNEIAVGGTILIQDGKFIPCGSIDDTFLELFKKQHEEEDLPTDRQFVANRVLLNSLCNLIILNDYVLNHKETVVETSRRIDIKPKSKKKKKHSPKKTKLVRYIKIDTQKVKKVSQKQDDNLEKREFERHTQQWTRRGHYRKLRNGVVKWIEPQIVTAKDKCKEVVNTKKLYKVQ